jgi:ABC-2 type transport system permease protein
VSQADGPVLRAALGSALYLALVGLMSLGVATAVRDAALAIGVVLALLYPFPMFAQLVTNDDWQ